jgi:DNA polymerase-1
LKWYGVEIKGKLFDTMLAHYLIDPDGKGNMDWLSYSLLKVKQQAIICSYKP